VIDATVSNIIDMCRSANIALILAHQRTKQIEDANVLSALENCAIKMANVDAEATYFSKLLHIPEERINNLPVGHFAMHVRGEGSSIVQVPLATLPYRMMTKIERIQMRRRMIEKYGYRAADTHERPSEEGRPATKENPQGEPRDLPIVTPKNISDPSKPAPSLVKSDPKTKPTEPLSAQQNPPKLPPKPSPSADPTDAGGAASKW
jgi:hypothetical protein